jgi:hypothetical protein
MKAGLEQHRPSLMSNIEGLLAEAKWTGFAAKLSRLELPHCRKPRADRVYQVKASSMRGTGKLNFRKPRDRAVQFSQGATGA